MTIKKSSGYCAPVAYASAYVSLDEFSREEIETHLRHLNGGDMLPDGSEGEFSFSGDEMGRRFVGTELKPQYYELACLNVEDALKEQAGLFAEAA